MPCALPSLHWHSICCVFVSRFVTRMPSQLRRHGASCLCRVPLCEARRQRLQRVHPPPTTSNCYNFPLFSRPPTTSCNFALCRLIAPALRLRYPAGTDFTGFIVMTDRFRAIFNTKFLANTSLVAPFQGWLLFLSQGGKRAGTAASTSPLPRISSHRLRLQGG